MSKGSRFGRRAGLVAAVVLALSGCGWPMLGGGAARGGFNPGEQALSTTTVGGLELQWAAPFEGTTAIGGHMRASPVVVNGTVYAASPDGLLFAFSTSDGSSRWPAPVAISTESATPAVVNGLVYVPDRNGVMTAFRAASGTVAWKATVGTVEGSSPAVVNGKVYVGGDHQTLYAYDAKTGAKVWSAKTGTQARSIDTSPAVAYDRVYVTTNDADFSDPASDPPSMLRTFDAAGGQPGWAVEIPDAKGFARTAPAVADGRVFVAGTVASAYDAHTGALAWSKTLPDINDFDYVTSPAVGGGMAYFVQPGASIVALDVATGAQRWRAEGAWSSPVFANGVVYTILDPPGPQYQGPTALRASDGQQLFHEYPTAWDNLGTPPPAVSDGHVYAGGLGELQSYGLPH
jgi:outer membrane protein assembly factor BamB